MGGGVHPIAYGVVTTLDVLGEKPLLITQNRQTRRSDLRVADVILPVDQVKALRIEDVKKANVGNIVTTLKRYKQRNLKGDASQISKVVLNADHHD